jgi:hypothetical protein
MMLHVLEFDIGRKEIWRPIDTFEAKGWQQGGQVRSAVA